MKTLVKVSLAAFAAITLAGASAHISKTNYHNSLVQSIENNLVKIDDKKNKVKPSVFVVEVEGMYKKELSDIFRMKLDAIYEEAQKGDKILLSIDSQGGSSVHCATDHYAVDMAKKDLSITVTTSIDRNALSCGFWLAVAGDEVYASGGALVANIGTVMPVIQNSIHSLVEKVTGDKVEFIGTTRNKELFAGDKIESKEDRDIVRGYVVDNGNAFYEDVRDARGALLKNEDRVFSANPIMAREAVELGLIDGLDTLSRLKRKYEQGGYELRNVTYRTPPAKVTFTQSIIKGLVGEMTSEETISRILNSIN